jgi:hypothetical protein
MFLPPLFAKSQPIRVAGLFVLLYEGRMAKYTKKDPPDKLWVFTKAFPQKG